MTKLKKVWNKAHTEYSITKIVGRPWHTHERGDRLQHYVPYGYATEAEARVEADRLNSKSFTTKRGDRFVVESTERPAGWSYEGTMSW